MGRSSGLFRILLLLALQLLRRAFRADSRKELLLPLVVGKTALGYEARNVSAGAGLAAEVGLGRHLDLHEVEVVEESLGYARWAGQQERCSQNQWVRRFLAETLGKARIAL
jgi:hypothetical protein